MAQRRNWIVVYPDCAVVYHRPFRAATMKVVLHDKGAAVFEKDGVRHVFTDVRLRQGIDMGDVDVREYTARYVGQVPA